MQSEKLFISFDDHESEKDLQACFKKFLKTRRGKLKINKSPSHADKENVNMRIRNYDNNGSLRELFLRQAFGYIGVPYAKRYWTDKDDEYYSSYFLDCCGLVRRVMRDLRHDFGFRLGPWNQGYMCDLLPIEYDNSDDMKPGDLVFAEGVYYDANRKPQKHNIMHVEIWLGDGEKTIGARWNKGRVQVFDSYRYESQNYAISRFIFKSIDTWLQGICRSFCKEHDWHFEDHYYDPGKYSIFSNCPQSDEDGGEECDSMETDFDSCFQ